MLTKTHLSLFKRTLLGIVFAGTLFYSCEKIEELLTFKIKNEANFTIPSAGGINTPFSIPTPDVPTNTSESFKNNNTDASKVKDVKLHELNLTITSPSNATFSRLKSIKIYIATEDLGETLLAYKENIPTSIGNTLPLEVTGENLDKYLKKESFDLKTEVVTREAALYDTTIKANMTFSVTAKL